MAVFFKEGTVWKGIREWKLGMFGVYEAVTFNIRHTDEH